MKKDSELFDRVAQLEKKYESTGQNMNSYLQGLLYANPLKYWDYTYVETLLSLQRPKTDFPDEMVFIIYHQITELYFKLTLHELDQICHNGKKISRMGQDRGWKDTLELDFFIHRMKRVNQYFDSLTRSFEIMVQGMEPDQFLKFRMTLLPASGFQSAQYRLIEISSTPLINLVVKNKRGKVKDASLEEQASHFYWKEGAMVLSTGKKTLMLKNFEKKYMDEFISHARDYEQKNIWMKYLALPKKEQENKVLIEQLRLFDEYVNVSWPLVHYKSAVRYLQMKEEDIVATGGTNWQKYLPPRFQKRIFFPSLWSDKEKANWGKRWVEDALEQE
jgi:tryptophan 2,3-dioxygenase